MARTKTKAAEQTPPKSPAKTENQDAFRETVESIVVAFVLAFLFRTFIAEAFVIPTGSMAPTLFGRHKDVVCVQCGHEYEVGASVEMNDEGNVLLGRITQAVCPNCRFRASIKELPVFKGDRILVNKFPYELGRPERWDVCVFKFPEDPERNYIKRMIGLPGETLRISRGDVFARPRNAADFRILRKDDPDKQLAIQIVVADDTHPPKKLLEKGWPERWAGMQPTGGPGAIDGWTAAEDGLTADAQQRAYRVKGLDWSWLRFRNFVPLPLDWDSVREGLPPTPNPLPQLVTDHYAYNTFDAGHSDRNLFWVGDLTVSGQMTVSDISGTDAALLLELVEGVRRYRCQIDLKSGTATLTHTDDLNPEGPPVTLGSAPTAVKQAGTYRFDFANVDDRLCLWINGSLIPFGTAAEYRPAALPDPRDGDLTPVGLAARGATVEFSKLVVKRDIYYRAEQVANDDRAQGDGRLSSGEAVNDVVRHQLVDALSQPSEYARIYNAKTSPIEFAALEDDEFFVMGDNSPQSQDSRLWSNRRGAKNRHAVPGNAFVGKAFLVYWPHGIPFLNDGKGYPILMHSIPKDFNPKENYAAYTFPFYPQFGRMFKRIR